jgi:hypothetical protein
MVCGRCLSVWGPRRSYYPVPSPPLHTVLYTYLHTDGEWGRANQREGKSGNSSQSWVENTNMTDCISSL